MTEIMKWYFLLVRYYEYKLYIDGRWFPRNHRLVIGENGALFPLGDIGTGKFVYEPNR